MSECESAIKGMGILQWQEIANTEKRVFSGNAEFFHEQSSSVSFFLIWSFPYLPLRIYNKVSVYTGI